MVINHFRTLVLGWCCRRQLGCCFTIRLAPVRYMEQKYVLSSMQTLAPCQSQPCKMLEPSTKSKQNLWQLFCAPAAPVPPHAAPCSLTTFCGSFHKMGWKLLHHAVRHLLRVAFLKLPPPPLFHPLHLWISLNLICTCVSE